MKNYLKAISVKKPEKGNLLCEDSSLLYNEEFIAVSDGAGGGGVFADRWSQYLVKNVSTTPITTFEEFSAWMEKIWNPFYDEYEKVAQEQGGMLLNKFYDEGSFATLVVAWKSETNKIKWIAYGDSVVFCYDRKTGELKHSFTSLSDFAKPPYLLNWKDEPQKEGFSAGEFEIEGDVNVFACSDALAHYVIMMYEVACGNSMPETNDKNSDIIALAKTMKVNFKRDVINPLLKALQHNKLEQYCVDKYHQGLLALDDYSLARLG